MTGFRVPARSSGVAALTLALCFAAPAARAEGLFSAFFDPSPERVVIQLEHSGYQIRSALLRRGDVYVCDATDGRGQLVRLVVDSRDGHILERFPARAAVYPGPRNYAMRDYVPEDDYAPGGPRPLVDVPLAPPRAFPLDPAPAPAPERHATNRAGIPSIEAPTLPDPNADKSKQKAKLHQAKPKPSPSPTSEANAAPTATGTAPDASAAPAAVTPSVPAAPPPAPTPAAAAPAPAPSPVAEAQTAPSPAPVVVAPAPVKPVDAKPGKKPINDLPVDPLN